MSKRGTFGKSGMKAIKKVLKANRKLAFSQVKIFLTFSITKLFYSRFVGMWKGNDGSVISCL